VLRLGVGDLLRLLSTFHATNAATFVARWKAVRGFAGFFMRELWASYVSHR
jgi:hypothetical protein